METNHLAASGRQQRAVAIRAIVYASLTALAACNGSDQEAGGGQAQSAVLVSSGPIRTLPPPPCLNPICTMSPLNANGGGPTQCTSAPNGTYGCGLPYYQTLVRQLQSGDAGGHIDVSWNASSWIAIPAATTTGCPNASINASLYDSSSNFITSTTVSASVCQGAPPALSFNGTAIGAGGDFIVQVFATVGTANYPAVFTVAMPQTTVYGATIQTFDATMLTADNDGGSSVSTNTTGPSILADWIIEDLNGGLLEPGDLVHIAHNSQSTGQFWYGSAENGGGPGSVFHINRSAAGGWEVFTISGTGGPLATPGQDSTSTSTTFQSLNGYYMSANNGGWLTGDGSIAVDRTLAGGWEWFTVNFTHPCTTGIDGFTTAPHCASSQACNPTSGCYVACTQTSCTGGQVCNPPVGCVNPMCTPNGCGPDGTCDPATGCTRNLKNLSNFVCVVVPGTNYSNCSYFYPGGSTSGIMRLLTSPSLSDMIAMVAQGYPDGVGQPRNKAIGLALQQVPATTAVNVAAGKCDGDAVAYYSPNQGIFKDTEWCSEFVRDMVLWSGAVKDKTRCDFTLCDIDPIGCAIVGPVCLHWAAVHEISRVDLWRAMFQVYGGWQSPIRPQFVQPGDYISMVNSEGQADGHSELVVGISADNSQVWTMSGNFSSGGPHCEAFAQHPFVISGGPTGQTVNANLNSTGNMSVLF